MEMPKTHVRFGSLIFEAIHDKGELEKRNKRTSIAKITVAILAVGLIVAGLGMMLFMDIETFFSVMLFVLAAVFLWAALRKVNLHYATIYETGVVIVNNKGNHEFAFDSLAISHFSEVSSAIVKNISFGKFRFFSVNGTKVEHSIEIGDELAHGLLPQFEEFTNTLVAMHTEYLTKDLTPELIKNKKFIFGIGGMTFNRVGLTMENGIFVNLDKSRRMPASFSIDDLTEIRTERVSTNQSTFDVLNFIGANERGKEVTLATVEVRGIVNRPALQIVIEIMQNAKTPQEV